MSINLELHYTKRQMLAFFCFATMFMIIGYVMNDCASVAEQEQIRITANIASYHMGEVRVDKPFAYYILTEKCLPDFFLEPTALGDRTRCDVYINSFKEKCEDERTPGHFKYIYKSKTTWTSARNLIYNHVKKSGRQYFYHIFMDDDIEPIFTEHMIRFGKKYSHREGDAALFEHYVQSEEGFKDAVYEEQNEKSAWRTFEDDLLIHSPALAVTNYVRTADGFESRLRMQKHWHEVCPPSNDMPWIIPTLYFDELFIALHREALPIMLPYSTMFDHINWQISGVLHVFRARALLYKQVMVNYRLTVINKKHREYPRGNIPKDIMKQYLKKDGKDLNGLIDEREMNYSRFDSWDKWESAFMHKRDLCSGPIKFPVWRHFRKK